MQATVVSLLLSEIGRDTLKFVAGLAATALIALLLVLILLLSLVEAVARAPGEELTPAADGAGAVRVLPARPAVPAGGEG